MIMSTFWTREVFTRKELWDFVHSADPDVTEATFSYILFDLRRKGKLRDVGTSIYTKGDKVEFQRSTDKMMTNLLDHLKRTSSLEGDYDIWTTEWLNEFMELQATSAMYILEVDKYSMERVFFSLRDTFPNVFSKPDRAVIETYITGVSDAIIIWPLISRAPINKDRLVPFPTLEKILVDLFCDTDLFYAYQGSQLVQIFQSALSNYPINFSRLFGYANRRNKQQEIKAFLLKHTDTKTAINSTTK